MLQEIEEITPTKKRLKVNIPADIIQAEIDSSYDKLRSSVRIPGFRQGKAPLSLLKKRFGKDVEADVIKRILPKYYAEAIESARLEPVGYPAIEEEIRLVPSQPLTFTVTVEVKPEIRELTYEGIELEERDASVNDNDVEDAINLLQENNALYTVTEDGANDGDMVVIDCEATIGGVHREEFSYKDYPFIVNSDALEKEFTDALKGRKKGDVVEVRVQLDASHPDRGLAGKEMVYNVRVKEVKKKIPPSLDDDFAKRFGADSMDELRKRLREEIEKRRQNLINLEYKREILNHLIENHDLSIPDSMVEAELNTLILEAKHQQRDTSQAIKTDEELRGEYLKTARENVKSVLLIEAIGKKEGVTVTDDEIKDAINEMAIRNRMRPEEVMRIYMMQEGSIEPLRKRLLADKVLDLILEKAIIKRRGA
ncbi:MAG: trigger factor [Thermodesulfovibrionia bacterium]